MGEHSFPWALAFVYRLAFGQAWPWRNNRRPTYLLLQTAYVGFSFPSRFQLAGFATRIAGSATLDQSLLS